VYGFPVVIADISFSVENKIFQITLFVQEGDLVNEIGGASSPNLLTVCIEFISESRPILQAPPCHPPQPNE
jgi:hypothetical protein